MELKKFKRKASELTGIHVRLPPEVADKVDEVARATGLSRSSILRAIILNHLDELEKFLQLKGKSCEGKDGF